MATPAGSDRATRKRARVRNRIERVLGMGQSQLLRNLTEPVSVRVVHDHDRPLTRSEPFDHLAQGDVAPSGSGRIPVAEGDQTAPSPMKIDAAIRGNPKEPRAHRRRIAHRAGVPCRLEVSVLDNILRLIGTDEASAMPQQRVALRLELIGPSGLVDRRQDSSLVSLRCRGPSVPIASRFGQVGISLLAAGAGDRLVSGVDLYGRPACGCPRPLRRARCP